MSKTQKDETPESKTPAPCPQCRAGKPCGGWLQPVAGHPGRWRCSKCGRAVYIRPATERGAGE